MRGGRRELSHRVVSDIIFDFSVKPRVSSELVTRSKTSGVEHSRRLQIFRPVPEDAVQGQVRLD
jgi:hypothetical protein